MDYRDILKKELEEGFDDTHKKGLQATYLKQDGKVSTDKFELLLQKAKGVIT